jgi:hypothetical protein
LVVVNAANVICRHTSVFPPTVPPGTRSKLARREPAARGNERIDLPENEEPASEPGGHQCRDGHQREAGKIAAHALIDGSECNRLRDTDRRMQIMTRDQRCVRP